MAACLICEGDDVPTGSDGYCPRCYDAAAHYATNTFDGVGSYRAYLLGLAQRSRSWPGPPMPGNR